MKPNTTRTPNIFMRCLKAPFKFLCRARDFYVDSMSNCAGRVHYGGSANALPKSFSVNSSRASQEEDIRALIRALSQRSQPGGPNGPVGANGLPKSFSVGIGRIDEDKPCEFNDDLKAKSDLLYPRSRSYAVANPRVRMYS